MSPYFPNLGNGLNTLPWYDSLGRSTGGWTCNGSTTHNCSGGTEIQGSLVAWKGSESTEICEDNPVSGQCSDTGFDEFGRMTSLTTVQGTTNNYSYTYDRYGNRWTQTQTAGSGGLNPSFNFNTANNQIDTNGVTYDAAGNMMNDGTNAYTYDAEGNITQVGSGGSIASYYYNALNQRVRTAVGSNVTEFVFNAAGQRVSEWNASTEAQTRGQYYWGSIPVGFYNPGSNVHFQHQNWLGTERVQTGYSGAIEGQFGSLPFGDAQQTTGSGDPELYATLDYDSETNTDHAQFRQYSLSQGHWMSPDPYSGGYDQSNPQSLNRYVYVQSNPLSLFDTLGLNPCDQDDTVCVDGGGGVCDSPGILCIVLPPAPGGGGGGSTGTGPAPSNKTCKTGFGAGLLVSADAGAGLGVTGAGGNVGAGVGLFGGNGVNAGAFASGGVGANFLGHGASSPTANLNGRNFVGAGGGAGGGIFLTNASQASQLSGPFATWNVDLGWVANGAAQFAVGTDSAGNTIWTFSFTLGWGGGFLYHNITTNTVVKGTGKGGC